MWLKTYPIILSPTKNLDGCTLMDTCIKARTWQAYLIFLPNILPVSSYFELFSEPLEVCILVKPLNLSASYSSKWPKKNIRFFHQKKSFSNYFFKRTSCWKNNHLFYFFFSVQNVALASRAKYLGALSTHLFTSTLANA